MGVEKELMEFRARPLLESAALIGKGDYALSYSKLVPRAKKEDWDC